MSNCDVILAVRNGENFLVPMLDSLLGQTTSDFNVIARDNASTDRTLEILENYKAKFHGRLRVIAGQSTGSSLSNFKMLLEETRADYVLCADHDDIWLPNKVAKTVKALVDTENKLGKSTPIYFFTDVIVVNRDLQEIQRVFGVSNTLTLAFRPDSASALYARRCWVWLRE